jgi:3-oxoacid CoA-transferase
VRPSQPFSKTTSTQYSTTAPLLSLAPKVEHGGSKLFKDADAAVADIKSGSTILSSGFGLCGVAGMCTS